MNYSEHISNPKTPQMEKANENQVKNSAGGYTFQIDNWKRLERFLIIGNEKGTYYASERKLTVENYDTILRLLKEDGKRVVDTIVTISDEGRAPRNAPAIFALAVCSVYGDYNTRTYANKKVDKVCRFSTALFEYVDIVNDLKHGKKGSGLKRVISRWYNQKTAKDVAYQVCKYPGRSVSKNRKWTHRDLLRISRPSLNRKGIRKPSDNALKIASEKHNIIYNYVVNRDKDEAGVSIDVINNWASDEDLKYIYAHETAKRATKSSEIVELIKNYRLTRESIPNTLFNKDVWEALLPGMPMTALIRNLGQMTNIEVLKPLGSNTKLAVEKITNGEALMRSRIHPMTIYAAKKVYDCGHGMKSSWKPVDAISNALEEAFYMSFKYVEPTGKNYLIGVDCSGSMGCGFYDDQSKDISPREAAAIVAMVIARHEKNHHIMGFTGKLVDLKISAKDSLEVVCKKMDRTDWGSTDCALPMIYATQNKLDVDCFVVLTDNESYAGPVHVFEAMNEYRRKFNDKAKFIAAAFTATQYSVADPDDSGMMDIVGLDSSIPQLISEFAKNNF